MRIKKERKKKFIKIKIQKKKKRKKIGEILDLVSSIYI